MANLIDQIELDGLREDVLNAMGMFGDGAGDYTISDAKTLITIRRVIEIGDLNPTTHKYDSPSTLSIYAGPAMFSPVTYRRDRQEEGGGESVRIRQYRCNVPWDAGDIHLDDYAIINFCEDPDVIGKIFDVTDVLYTSEMAVRRLSLVDTTKDISGLDC